MKPKSALLVLILTLLVGTSGAAFAKTAIPASAMSEKVMGNLDAKVTIIEYASLTCPHCAKFHTEILPHIKAAFIDSGKAKLVYRDFPLDQTDFSSDRLELFATRPGPWMKIERQRPPSQPSSSLPRPSWSTR